MPITNIHAKGMVCKETCKENKGGKCTREVVNTNEKGKCLDKK